MIIHIIVHSSSSYAESSPSDASADTDDEDKQTLAEVLGSKNVNAPSSSNLRNILLQYIFLFMEHIFVYVRSIIVI